jgi:hypothetical protein
VDGLIDALEEIIPVSFYGDRGIVFRVERLVDSWKRTVESNQRLEKELEVKTCTRQFPHICKVIGPCNGWPKEAPDDNDALRSDARREGED